MKSPTPNSKTFGNRLIEAMKNRGITDTEKQVEKIFKVYKIRDPAEQEYLETQEYLNAVSCPAPLNNKLKTLADALGVDETWLLNGQKPTYIPYLKAFKLLSDRFNATPEEIAAWVWMGPNEGGLAGYLNANEMQLPPRFFFDDSMGEDHLEAMMACWFILDEVTKFQPPDRFITGKDLIERWSTQPGIKVEAFVRAKIAESRLLDFHPTMGATQWSAGNDFPTKETALFSLAHVESVEAEDFGIDEVETNVTTNSKPFVSAMQIKLHFAVINANEDANHEWWTKMMRNASDNGLHECRIGCGKRGRGGSLWRPDLIAAWLVERNNRKLDGISNNAARAALKKFTGYEEIAEQLFPKDE